MKVFRITALLAVLAASTLFPGVFNRATAEDAAAKVTCPITGESFVDSADHPGTTVDGSRVAFCCANCPKNFAANPEKHITKAMLGKCPIMGGPNKLDANVRVVLNNGLYYFCCGGCDKKFSTEPSKYVKSLKDVVSTKDFTPAADSPRSEYKQQVYLFDNADDKATFDKTPDKYAVVYGKA